MLLGGAKQDGRHEGERGSLFPPPPGCCWRVGGGPHTPARENAPGWAGMCHSSAPSWWDAWIHGSAAPSSHPQCGAAPLDTEHPHILGDRGLLTGSEHTFPSSCLSSPSLGHAMLLLEILPLSLLSRRSQLILPEILFLLPGRSELLLLEILPLLCLPPGAIPTCGSCSELLTHSSTQRSPWNQAEGRQKALGLQILQQHWN